jgi:hypothetical protein
LSYINSVDLGLWRLTPVDLFLFSIINFVSYVMNSGLIGGEKFGQIKKLPSEPPQSLGMCMETLAHNN